jgi:hypothetical protein
MKKQLPPRPNLEHLKKQAKAILKSHHSGDSEILKRIREEHPRWRKSSLTAIQKARFTLSDAQLVIAQEYGFENWAKLKAHVERAGAGPTGEEAVRALRDAACEDDAEDPGALERRFHDYGLFPYGTEEWYTPLAHAVTSGRTEIVRVLLEHGANEAIRSPEGQTLIEIAREKGHPEVAALLR